eukprot:6211946-Pleurochrysis_carterae.AAC.3
MAQVHHGFVPVEAPPGSIGGLRVGVARRTLVFLDALVDSSRSPSLFFSHEIRSDHCQRASGGFNMFRWAHIIRHLGS